MTSHIYVPNQYDSLFYEAILMPTYLEDPKYDSYGPSLSDEVDLQEWARDQMVATPQHSYTEIPEYTITRGNGSKATSWSDKDYGEMSLCPISIPRDPKDLLFNREQDTQDSQDSLVPAIESTTPSYNVQEQPHTHTHTRVQVTQTYKGKYVKGESGNFEIHLPYQIIFQALQVLTTVYPKQRGSAYKVRVQLQSKTSNKMQGGANLSLHNARIPEIMAQLSIIFDERGWLSPKSEKKDSLYINGVPTEGGSQKPEASVRAHETPTPLRHQTKISPKKRISASDAVAMELLGDLP